jgi:RNA-binding protein
MKESEKAWLRGRGQLLEPTVHLGHQGVTAEFLAELNRQLDDIELVKIRFSALKDQRKTLSPQIAQQSGCEYIGCVGHTALFFRRQADPQKRRYQYETGREIKKGAPASTPGATDEIS